MYPFPLAFLRLEERTKQQYVSFPPLNRLRPEATFVIHLPQEMTGFAKVSSPFTCGNRLWPLLIAMPGGACKRNVCPRLAWMRLKALDIFKPEEGVS